MQEIYKTKKTSPNTEKLAKLGKKRKISLNLIYVCMHITVIYSKTEHVWQSFAFFSRQSSSLRYHLLEEIGNSIDEAALR